MHLAAEISSEQLRELNCSPRPPSRNQREGRGGLEGEKDGSTGRVRRENGKGRSERKEGMGNVDG